MGVKTPCEIIVEKFLPQIRSMVALELKEKYGLRGNVIANLIGCSDAAVSQYLHGVRGTHSEFLSDFPEIQGFVESVSKELYEKREEGMELTEKLGEICSRLRGNKLFVEMYSKGKDSKFCDLCFGEGD